jgi:CHAT domain-containing protein/Tfp pilus assembly protein PilF
MKLRDSRSGSGWRRLVAGVGLVAVLSATETLVAQTVPADPQVLPIGRPTDKEIAADGSDIYYADLKKGELLTLEVQPEKIDVMAILGTVDEQLIKLSNYGDEGHKEFFIFEAPENAVYMVLIKSNSLEKGKFRITARTETSVSAESAKRLAAEAAMQEAQQLVREAEAKREELMKKPGQLTLEDAKLLEDLPVAAARAAAVKWSAASTVWSEIGDKFWQAATLHRAGSELLGISENSAALKNFLPALAIRKQIGDRRGESQTAHDAAKVYLSTGEITKAQDLFNQAVTAAKATGDRGFEAHLLADLGTTEDELGNAEKAVALHRQSLEISRAIGDKGSTSLALNNIGTVYVKTGEAQQAMKAFNEALPIAEALKDQIAVGQIVQNIGAVYEYLGENDKAIQNYARSNAIFGEAGYTQSQVESVRKVAGIFVKIGDYQSALINYQRALDFFTDAADASSQAYTLSDIAFVYNGLGDSKKAVETWQQALTLFQKLGDQRGVGTSLSNLGQYYAESGDKAKALDHHLRSLPLRRAARDKEGEIGTLSALMQMYATGNTRLAAFYGKQAANLSQELRDNTQSFATESQRQFLKGKEANYRFLAEILLDLGRTAEAQQVLNSFKDQQFLDLDRKAKPSKLDFTPREAQFFALYDQASERVGTVGSRLRDLKRLAGSEPTPEQTAQIAKLEAELKTASSEFSAAIKKAEVDFSKPANDMDKIAQIRDLTEMQTILRRVSEQTGEKTVAIYQLAGERNFHAIVLTSDVITKISTPTDTQALQERALKFWGLLQSPNYDPTKLGNELYKTVFQPLEKELPKDTKTILWSLDGNLRYLPMATLYDGKNYLIERYNHVNFTRADQERMTRPLKPAWTATGLGTTKAHTTELLGERISFDALPGVGEELQVVLKPQSSKTGGIFNGESLADAKFDRAGFLTAMKQKRPVVHIASHFAFRAGDEARSFLLLGDGTPFTLEEMKQNAKLFDGVDLLTLSACNTAAQQADAYGKEIDGFAELAQRLGANAVMATLWPVADASTPWLMREFYLGKEEKKLSKVESLRQAQMALLKGNSKTRPSSVNRDVGKIDPVVVTKDGQPPPNTTRGAKIYMTQSDAPPYERDDARPYAHPHYWAPFILFGNWQ